MQLVRWRMFTARAALAAIMLANVIFPALPASVHGAGTEGEASGETPAATTGPEWRQVIEDFEEIGDLRVTSVRANSAELTTAERPYPVQYGLSSGRLDYDFTGNEGTSAAYIRFRSPAGPDGRDLPGNPRKIGFWLYGEDKAHWIRGQIQGAGGTTYVLDFTGSGERVNGWKYVSASIPAGASAPYKLNYIYVVETGTKTAGTIYVDQVSLIYEETDIYNVEWSGIRPLAVGESVYADILVTRKGDAEPESADGEAVYSSSDESVATIEADGKVTAVGPGTAELKAVYRGEYEEIYRLDVTEEPPQPDFIQIEGPLSLVVTETAPLKAYAVFDGGEPAEVTAETRFEVSPDEVAELVRGELRAVAPGSAEIKASFRGSEFGYTVEVKSGELKSIEIANVFSAIVGGEPVQAKVIGDYKVEGKKEITEGVRFSSSDPLVASIDETTGVITAAGPGTAMVTAEADGKTARQMIVVTSAAAPVKRELRGAWISTVENIDWPAKGDTDPERQRQDFVSLLDRLAETGINAVFVQIRPTSDSFYPSEYFPWSHWLTGEQGQPPSDGYDPLAFMIEETHKRNIEFHAWINPYRVSMQADPNALSPDHPARLHPDWIVANGGKLYFNPGVPEAKNYIIGGVKEIVENYDIDGIHMDDYFYPYPGNEPFDDGKQYDAYRAGGGTLGLADWRRANVNSIVEGLHDAIKEAKPYVKFGISPFGIWRNKSTDPTGSDTNGQQNYDGLYADTRTWIKEGWIDYIAPQIYWHFGYSAAAYEKLIDWWTKEINGENDGSGPHPVHLYIGQAAYRVGEANWTQPDQLPAQLRFNRDQDGRVAGSIFFSSSHLLANPLSVRDRIADMYRTPALVPDMPWLPGETPGSPNLIQAKSVNGQAELKWKEHGNEKSAYYAIYRTEGDRKPDPDDAAQLIATVRAVDGPIQTFTDTEALEGRTYTYAVTAVSRLHRESELSDSIAVRID
ncbi:family 10 glycosylhydrolase [Paenibacillus thailandensis]|uniref:Family 10 glycosylhydrolase n=1 Tax=Paenibacillus thailandensis TaxID=393250 RepID=A0ABW5QUC8_9BACL